MATSSSLRCLGGSVPLIRGRHAATPLTTRGGTTASAVPKLEEDDTQQQCDPENRLEHPLLLGKSLLDHQSRMWASIKSCNKDPAILIPLHLLDA
jgi:hypothetical protein